VKEISEDLAVRKVHMLSLSTTADDCHS